MEVIVPAAPATDVALATLTVIKAFAGLTPAAREVVGEVVGEVDLDDAPRVEPKIPVVVGEDATLGEEVVACCGKVVGAESLAPPATEETDEVPL
ncbi:unnamed protein product [Acidithrix sp. C25]|nr:unnamed protein product [Acidithrix sp. C25]